ncbi:S-layer homology domain-containing protein [Paenibacillus eucommiae]|uniref:SLH domain-containing protein n=1 Tax=Paenibacillus eucommiae TaxID=1355755 RepID=A0ABS4JAM3_9BACL|nr:S-layer homology domain-containing protein [Paenibacillus eucommiae]MBP1996855.1 hypothetical protein [Paenibacillus eucommiae]
MKKKWMLLAMSIMLIFTMAQSAWAFSDIQSSPHAEKIQALKKAGILSGEANGKFNPDGKLTYAAGVSMIVKGLDVSFARFLFNKAPLASDYFTNVKDGAWYSEAFIIAHVNGLDIPKDVKPDQLMTKEQFAHHLFRAMEANGDHAYTMQFIMVKDEADITPAYSDSVQKLLITHIAELDKEQKFAPKTEISRGEAASWLFDAMEFVANTPVGPDPQPEPNPLTDMKLESKAINDKVNEITISAQAPHPGYGFIVTGITFNGSEAIIHTETVLPDPDKMYPQVLTEIKLVTYVGSAYKPVLDQAVSISMPSSTGIVGDTSVE